MIPKLHNQRRYTVPTMSMNCALSTITGNLGVTLWTLCPTSDISYRMTKNEDMSNPSEVRPTETKTLAVENIVDKKKYLTILFFSQHYTHLDTCPKYHPRAANYDIWWKDLETDQTGTGPTEWLHSFLPARLPAGCCCSRSHHSRCPVLKYGRCIVLV